MSPLIEIKSVPIEIEMKVSPAKLEYTRGTADLEISRSNSGVQIKSSPIRLNMDTFSPSNVVMPKSTPAMSGNAVTGGGNTVLGGGHAVYQATASYAQQGQLLLNAHISQGISQGQAAQANSQAAPAVFAAGGSGWDPTEMNIRYEMDKLNFDWRTSQLDFEFTPGNIEISVTQQPDVVITYVGGPIYVPRSADPNYQPVDVQA